MGVGLFLGITILTVMVFATAAKFAIEAVLDFMLFFLVGAAIGLVHGRLEGGEPAA